MEENKKLEEVVYEAIKRFPGISRTQLVKLVYVIDREYFKENGNTLTGVEYELYFYGPYSHEFKKVLDNLKENDAIYENFDGVSYGIFLTERQKKNSSFEERENKAIESAIKQLTKDGKLKSTREIKSYVYSFDEVKSTAPFEKIVFNDQGQPLEEHSRPDQQHTIPYKTKWVWLHWMDQSIWTQNMNNI